MANLFDKVELLEEVAAGGKRIVKGTRGMVVKTEGDVFTIELKLSNPRMLRAYEFYTVSLPREKFRIVELKGGNSLMSGSTENLNLY